ncbi:hypothetical protein EIN_313410 [Entamoeba invadens IP1]|uniref:Uncharacterized protein n=1 Tax=Entamoeba invadens IP1 TaxID=370355 RepID=A0A0A1UCP6_ENTIV|nr:hypothetical protein EIN_313410 [Entamoeba invadens IP1]ELP92939.1 hypothetical protein EIN_313410 [Entamoeba invadens IP1]|eukprot:XP_004259710.1 hypothetical protein EIN_313410 [Entamoeba invadens IP1]
MDIITLLKVLTVISPETQVIFQGHYEEVLQCKTIEEMMYCFGPIMTRFFLDEAIPYEKRYEIFAAFGDHKKMIARLEPLLNALDPQNTGTIKTFINDIQIIKSGFCGHLSTPNEEMFQHFLDYHKEIIAPKEYNISHMVDPFYAPISQLTEKMKCATPTQLSQVAQVLSMEHKGMVFEDDIELDLNTLSTPILLRLLTIFH